MHIKQQQQRDSVRLVWNTLPNTKALMVKAAIPQAIHYTPLNHPNSSVIHQSPPQCSKCHAFINPYNPIHLGKQHYTCCICKCINKLPDNYIKNKQQMPEELTLGHSSFLFEKQSPTSSTHINYLFLVDIGLNEPQLQAIKDATIQFINHTQNDRSIGLISYDKYANLFDLGDKMSSHIKISPNHSLKHQQLKNMLLLNNQSNYDLKEKYIVELSKSRISLTDRVKELRKVEHKGGYKAERQAKAVGQALNLAISVAEMLDQPTKIIFFCGGVCTIGPGKVIDSSFKVQMRSISQNLPNQSQQAIKYYKSLGERMNKKGIILDSFIFSVQETGLSQMLPCLKSTGGLLVQHQQFKSTIFKDSFKKAYISLEQFSSLYTASDASVNIKTSPQILLTSFQGIKKQDISLYKNMFKIYGIHQFTTFSFCVQLKDAQTQADAFYVQIVTTFRDDANLHHLLTRITTIRRPFVSHHLDLIKSFDQQAALHFLTKQVAERLSEQKQQVVRNWLDSIVVKWAKQFGIFKKGDSESFKLPQNCRFFPQYIYYLRRSPIMRKARISLDEYNYIKSIVKQQTTRNILLIIQPAMISYTTEDTDAKAVSLDEKYMRPQSILLLDSFFNIVEWKGKNIHSWFQNKLQDTQQYAYIKEMHQNLTRDVDNLKWSRFPSPHLYVTHPGHSKERFIKSRLSSRDEEPQQGNLTEEADIHAFTSMLIQLVVNQ